MAGTSLLREREWRVRRDEKEFGLWHWPPVGRACHKSKVPQNGSGEHGDKGYRRFASLGRVKGCIGRRRQGKAKAGDFMKKQDKKPVLAGQDGETEATCGGS